MSAVCLQIQESSKNFRENDLHIIHNHFDEKSALEIGTLFSFEARKYMEIRITRQKSQSVMAQCGR